MGPTGRPAIRKTDVAWGLRPSAARPATQCLAGGAPRRTASASADGHPAADGGRHRHGPVQHPLPGPADGRRDRATARQPAPGRLVRPRGPRGRPARRDRGEGGDPGPDPGPRDLCAHPLAPPPGRPRSAPGTRRTAHPLRGRTPRGEALRLRPPRRTPRPCGGHHGPAARPHLAGAPCRVRARAGPSDGRPPPSPARRTTGGARQPVPATAAYGRRLHHGAMGGRGRGPVGRQPHGGGPRDRQGGPAVGRGPGAGVRRVHRLRGIRIRGSGAAPGRRPAAARAAGP
jgi:hypothetical protein